MLSIANEGSLLPVEGRSGGGTQAFPQRIYQLPL